MQQLTRYCAGWVAAATLATSVSYAAIQNLVVTAALGQPVHAAGFGQVAPVPTITPNLTASTPAAAVTGSPAATPSAIATSRPTAHPSRSSTARSTPRVTTPSTHPSTPVRAATTPTPTPPDAPVTGYTMRGGQVTLELLADSATLVSAVPAAGYSTQTWHTDTWIRVDFVSGGSRSSLIVSWFEHAPLVEQSET